MAFVAAFVVSLLLAIVAYVAAEALKKPPDNELTQPKDLGDFQFPTATEGRPIPILFGQILFKGPNVVWYGNLEQIAIKESIRVNLWSKKRITVGYRYKVGIQFAFCEGQIDYVDALRVGGKYVFSGPRYEHLEDIDIDQEDFFGGDKLGDGGIVASFQVYDGRADQQQNLYLQTFSDITLPANLPGYNNLAYISNSWGTSSSPGSTHGPGAYIGNKTNIEPWEWRLARFPNGLGLTTPAILHSNAFGSSANPMNVLYELFTNQRHGMGVPASRIDTAGWTTAAETLETEGNSFSFLWDRELEARQVIDLVLAQIDAVIYEDPVTQQHKVTLIRGGYTIGDQPALTDDNILSVESFVRTTWEGTINHVRVEFTPGGFGSWETTFARAQDLANRQIQDGQTVVGFFRFPGCKDPALANKLAWRELRSAARPLAQARVIVGREFWELHPGDVVSFSTNNSPEAISQLAMRVSEVDLGEIDDGRISLLLVEDVFVDEDGVYGDPFDTVWTEPADDLDPFPSNEQLAFESPKAFTDRDPDALGAGQAWCSGRQQGVEVGFDVVTDNGGFITQSEPIVSFMKMGTLTAALDSGTDGTVSSITITPVGNTASEINAEFEQSPSTSDMGTNLFNLIMIDNEFMFVTSSQVNGTDVDLQTLYRAALDSVQEDHAINADVYIISGVLAGGGLNGRSGNDGDMLDIDLLPRSFSDIVSTADSNTISFTLDARHLRPYPISRLTLDGTAWSSSTSLEANGSGAEDFAIDVGFRRRDFRTAEGNNEIEALQNDAAALFSDFPDLNGTVHEIDVYNGTSTLLFTDTAIAGTQHDISRLEILKATDGVLPTTMRIDVRTSHTIGSTIYTSRYNQRWDFSVTSALTGQFEFTALDTNDVSAVYTADAAGDHDFTLSSAFTTGDVEYRLNAGVWTTLISSGGTSGTISGVSISDTIEIRHGSTDSSVTKQIDMDAPGAGTDAFGILFT